MIDIVTMENKRNIHRIVNHLISKGAERFAFVGDIYSANVGRGFQERFDASYCLFLSFHYASTSFRLLMIV